MKTKSLSSRVISSIKGWLKKSFKLTIYHLTSRRFIHLICKGVDEEKINKQIQPDFTLSIVAVSYARFGELKVFVQSVINQTQNNWKLHVLHDGHNDDFCNIMEEYRRDNPKQISYECTKTRFNDYGHSLREIGLEKATGEYILITNADNYYSPKALEFINKAIVNNAPKPDVVMFDMVHSHTNPGLKKAPSYSFFKVIYKRNFIDMGAAIAETSLAKRSGFADKSYSADATYFENILKKKLESGSRLVVVKIPRVLLTHN